MNYYEKLQATTNKSDVDSVLIIFVTEYSIKYHRSGCRYIEGKENLTEFSIDDAENTGYSACKICIGE